MTAATVHAEPETLRKDLERLETAFLNQLVKTGLLQNSGGLGAGEPLHFFDDGHKHLF